MERNSARPALPDPQVGAPELGDHSGGSLTIPGRGPPILLIAIALFYMALGATLLAFRHRTPETSARRDLRIAAAWLGGTVITLVLIIIVASVFDLTGA